MSRLIDLIIYSNMESKGTNPGIHRTFRLILKKKLYIRCMKVYPDLFKGKKEFLESKQKGVTITETSPYIWNSSIEGDELCAEVLKKLKTEDAMGGLASEGIKLQLKQMYDEMVADFDLIREKIKN